MGSVEHNENLIYSRTQNSISFSLCFRFLALIVSEIWRSHKSIYWEIVRKFPCLKRFYARQVWSIYLKIWCVAKKKSAHIHVLFQNYNSHSFWNTFGSLTPDIGSVLVGIARNFYHTHSEKKLLSLPSLVKIFTQNISKILLNDLDLHMNTYNGIYWYMINIYKRS